MSPLPAPALLPTRTTLPAREAAGRARPAGAGSRSDRPVARRGQLRLVDNAHLDLAVRRRRARRLLAVGVVLAIGALLALAGVNAVLVSNQVRLDELERSVIEAQARHQVLRLEVATLEAPERIVTAAIDRLGMVVPETITYLQPVADGADGDPGSTGVVEPAQREAAWLPWGAIKPYLSR